MSSSQPQPPVYGSGPHGSPQDAEPSPVNGRTEEDQGRRTQDLPDNAAAEQEDESFPQASITHPRVDEAVARMAELDSLPTGEHAVVYEDVDRRLHGALTELDDE